MIYAKPAAELVLREGQKPAAELVLRKGQKPEVQQLQQTEANTAGNTTFCIKKPETSSPSPLTPQTPLTASS